MTDFENRLRAAMQCSVAAEQPPNGLLGQVRRRHRRHRARLGAVGLALVAAIALVASPARSALLNTVSTHPAAAASVPPGQVYGCDAQTDGALSADWRTTAVYAAPVWIINRGLAPGFSFRNPDGTLKAVPLIVLVPDNVTVSVAPAPEDQPYLRFLSGFKSTDEYTAHDGLPTATFAACPDSRTLFGQGLTEYYIGVTVDGPRCITLDARSAASRTPQHARLRFGSCP